MKTTSLIIFLSCLLFTFSSNFFLGTSQILPEAVLDTSGQQLRRGVNYYILPANRRNGGGLTLANGRNGSCPYEIVQALNQGANGLPLRFSPINNDSIIRENTDNNIWFVNFSSPIVCPQSNVWQLVADGESPPPYFVTIGGVEGNPGRDTLPNWFQIQKYEDAYQIVYCPNIPCQPCRVLCGNIGIFVDNGRRRLAINQPPFKVVFRRA
ncbi:hypothetical protein ACH5RR_025135 [Cinchona calisaya]|uniref:Uncharacterized protein n=1 Tax=Cinchona calisaya TaxID=153742 RepID=A0ABD2Z3T3_9GENT